MPAVPAPATRARILIADDSDVCRTVLAILLKNSGHDVTSVVNGREALAKLREQTYDFAILDNEMPELDGLSTLAALRQFAPHLPVAIVSGTLSAELRTLYEKHGIEALFDKPVDPRKLRDQIPLILEKKRQAQTGATATGSSVSSAPFQVLGESDAALEKPVFAGASAQVRKLVADFGRIRDFRSAATVTGRPGAAFLDVAVALAEERDAMLLACDAKEVSAARLGRLFTPSLQTNRQLLLIVLGAHRLDLSQQELLENLLSGATMEFAALNGRTRLILCAQTDLGALADAGEFSEALLMRAGAMRLNIPPLAQRRGDTPQIARAVLRRIGAANVRLSDAALAWIERTDWPGDYDQLHRVVELARLGQRDDTVLDAAQIQEAFNRELTHTAPLFQDLFLASLRGE